MKLQIELKNPVTLELCHIEDCLHEHIHADMRTCWINAHSDCLRLWIYCNNPGSRLQLTIYDFSLACLPLKNTTSGNVQVCMHTVIKLFCLKILEWTFWVHVSCRWEIWMKDLCPPSTSPMKMTHGRFPLKAMGLQKTQYHLAALMEEPRMEGCMAWISLINLFWAMDILRLLWVSLFLTLTCTCMSCTHSPKAMNAHEKRSPHFGYHVSHIAADMLLRLVTYDFILRPVPIWP